jgi:hypothetical protein
VNTRQLLPIVIVLTCLIRAARAATLFVPTPEAVEVLAASDAGIVAVSSVGVSVLDARGRPIRTLWERRSLLRSINRPRPDLSPLPGLTGDSDWAAIYDPDDVDDSDDPRLEEAEARVADPDGPAHRKHPAHPIGNDPPGHAVVSIGGSAAWLGRADGLWRIDLFDGAATRVFRSSVAGIRLLSVSSDGGVIALVVGNQLLRSHDGGTSFEPLTTLDSIPRALVATPTGTILWVAEGKLRQVNKHGDSTDVDASGVTDVMGCGADVVILRRGALHVLYAPHADERTMTVVRVAQAPNAIDQFTCSTSGAVWLVRGNNLWTSSDRGITWSRHSEQTPPANAKIVVTDSTIWIGTPLGIWGWPVLVPRRSDDAPPTRRSVAADVPRMAAPGRSGPTWRWWYTALPVLDLSFDAAQTAGQRQWSALIAATFSFDPPGTALNRAADFAREIARRRNRFAEAHMLERATGDDAQTDPIAAEERRAMAQIVEEVP